MTYTDWLEALGHYRTEHPEQRAGQSAFNSLYQNKPMLADWIQFETNLDPFHFDSKDQLDRIRLKAFFEFVRVNWEKF